jgi:hypothetical protein
MEIEKLDTIPNTNRTTSKVLTYEQLDLIETRIKNKKAQERQKNFEEQRKKTVIYETPLQTLGKEVLQILNKYSRDFPSLRDQRTKLENMIKYTKKLIKNYELALKTEGGLVQFEVSEEETEIIIKNKPILEKYLKLAVPELKKQKEIKNEKNPRGFRSFLKKKEKK